MSQANITLSIQGYTRGNNFRLSLYDVTTSTAIYSTSTMFYNEITVQADLQYGHIYYIQEYSYNRSDTIPYTYKYWEIDYATINGLQCPFGNESSPAQFRIAPLDISIAVKEYTSDWQGSLSNRRVYFTLIDPRPSYIYDLTQLSLTAGTHSITAKAKKAGYIDSDASNAVSYTVYPKIAPPERNEVTTAGAGTYVGMKSSFIDEAEEYEYFIDGVSVGKAPLSFLVGACPVGYGGTGSSCTIYGKVNSDTVSTTDYTWKVDSNGVWTSQYSINEQIPNVTKVALMSSVAQGNPMAVSLIGGGNIMQSTTPFVVRIYGDGILGLVYHFTG